MLLILDPQAPEELLEAVLDEVRTLGWTPAVSRGEEQIAVALDGPGDPARLEAAMARLREVDVVPVMSTKQWGRLRARRRFLAATASGLGVLTAIGAGLPLLGYLTPARDAVSDRVLQRAARVDELEEYGAKQLDLHGRPVMLIRMNGERFYAVSAVCTYMSVCRLEWQEDRRQLVCPCHGGAFDVYGNVVQGPASVPLRTWPVRRVGGDVYIDRLG